MDPSAYAEIADVENRHWWFLARRKIVATVIESLNLPQSSKILEIGAGTGGNLSMLAGFGDVHAVEMDEFARKKAIDQTQGRIDIRYGRCPDVIPFENLKFDLVCLLDVLEHVKEDEQTLSALHARLAAGGHLLITVPANKWMWSGHDVFLHHMRRYTKRELRDKLRHAGFREVHVTSFNTLLFPLAAISRVWDKITKRNVDSVNKLPPEPVNRLLRAIFQSEQAVVKRGGFPFGVSLIAIATQSSS